MTDTKNDKMLSKWLQAWEGEFLREVLEATDAERACETFPGDRILNFFELINSNTGIILMGDYRKRAADGYPELVHIIADHIGAEKYRLSASQLRRRVAQAKKGKK